jgi:hypothetical protein
MTDKVIRMNEGHNEFQKKSIKKTYAILVTEKTKKDKSPEKVKRCLLKNPSTIRVVPMLYLKTKMPHK